MKKIFLKNFILLNLLLLCLIFVIIAILIKNQNLGNTPDTIERIRQTGKLRLITANSLNTYYYYEDQPTGFEYDLAMEFAKYLNVELDVVTPGWNNMFSYLNQGKGDFIAAGLAITKERLEHADFSIPYMTIQQRVIYHNLVFAPRNVEDLIFRTFHIRRGTSYHSRLEKIKTSGIDINYILHDNIPTEELISMVNDRQIRFTIADSNIALLSQRYYPDIRIGIPIQEKESLAWAARKNDDNMIIEINRFLLYANENGILINLIEKYYDNTHDFDIYELKKFHQRLETRLPKYKKLIMEESKKYGFDWRLVAAVVYQESHFNPNAKSFTNVRGLMQVTRETAQEMGITNRNNPTQSIRAGIKYLDKMYQRFSHIEDNYQRMLFSLASYNVGYGHVLDALKIAQEKGLDPTTWQTLKTTLPLLSKSRYFKTSKYGYARGWEPIHYVERILTYFDILKQKTRSSKLTYFRGIEK
ncbi:MAG: membrane-bound lytic murein transglycosylase MltF [Desulfobacteraceae bacterium]|nr:membrane-bound lytic murein transglycosylase MltF [Desulfobacteraceae bacterium]